MGPRHASGGLGRTPNPGLAVCAGQRTRASRDQAPNGRVYGVPCHRTLPANAQETSFLLWLWLLPLRVQGGSPAVPPIQI